MSAGGPETMQKPDDPMDEQVNGELNYQAEPPAGRETVNRVTEELARWLPAGGTQAPDIAAWGAAEWQVADWVAYWQGLSAWLAARLDSCGMQAPAPVDHRLRAIAVQIRERTRRMMAAAAELLGTLGAIGVPAMPLKGGLLAASYYPDPGIRALGDLDILIQRQDLPQARLALQELNYRFFKRTEKDEAYLRGERKALVWAADNVHPVELQHRAVYEFAGRTLDLTDDLWTWSRVQPYLEGAACPAPDPAGAFSHVCAHASADWILGQGKISQIQDLQVCAAKMAAEDWQALRSRVKPRAARFLYPSIAVACRFAQLAIPAEFLDWLHSQSPAPLQAWAGETRLAQVFALHGDANIRRDYAADVARLFTAGRRDQIETLVKLLFPPRWHSRLDAFPRLVASPLWPLAWVTLNVKRVKEHYSGAVGQKRY